MKRQSTRGRRRPGERAPPLATGAGGPGVILTQPSPQSSPRRDGGFDEEANMGINSDSRIDTSTSVASLSAGPAPSYSMFPQSGLQPFNSAPASSQPSTAKGQSINQRMP